MVRSRALITGASKRVGGAMIEDLAKKGFNLIIHYNNSQDDALDLQRRVIEDYQVECDVICGDLTENKNIQDFADRVFDKYNDIDLLVNNASIFTKSSLGDFNLDEFDRIFNIHLKAAIILSLKMKVGNIINVLDKNITRYKTQYFSYLIAKKSLAEFTKIAALQLAPKIRVNAIAPGCVLYNDVDLSNKKQMDEILSRTPLQKSGNINNFLQGMNYLLDNDYVNGEILFIDGGDCLNNVY